MSPEYPGTPTGSDTHDWGPGLPSPQPGIVHPSELVWRLRTPTPGDEARDPEEGFTEWDLLFG
jgi:hypothetical protein